MIKGSNRDPISNHNITDSNRNNTSTSIGIRANFLTKFKHPRAQNNKIPIILIANKLKKPLSKIVFKVISYLEMILMSITL